MGIGPTYLPWEGSALPLSYGRKGRTTWQTFAGRLSREDFLKRTARADDNLEANGLSTNSVVVAPLIFGLHQPVL